MRAENFREIMEFIGVERDRQDEKWGKQVHLDTKWLTILVEEVGEVAKAILERQDKETLEHELVQVAAVCCLWLEDLSNRENDS